MSDDFTQPEPDEYDAELLQVEQLLRSLTVDDLVAPTAPPESVWAGIESKLAADGELPASTQAPTVRSIADHRARRGTAGRPFLLAAAAVVLMIAGAIVVVATRGGDAEVLATAQLSWSADFDPLGEGATSNVELVEAAGGYELVIAGTDLPDEIAQVEDEADLELWLISTDPATGEITDVQPVQKISGSPDGTYAVPDRLDPDTYTVVDISIEPRDGDEAHSGRSILRGQLTA